MALASCTGAHVLDFLRYLDQVGKTKVHLLTCHFFGLPNPPHPCPCPLRQAWGSLDALIGRLRAAFEENGGKAEANPFGASVVRMYLREVRENQAKARGIAYEKKRRKRPLPNGNFSSNEEQQNQQPSPQGHSHANPLTGHGDAQHTQHSQQHMQHSQQHSHHSQHSQHNHSPGSQQNHCPVSHPLTSYATSSNPLSPGR